MCHTQLSNSVCFVSLEGGISTRCEVSIPAPNTANWKRVEPPVGNVGASHYPASQPLTISKDTSACSILFCQPFVYQLQQPSCGRYGKSI
ncbi:hypothetical protein NQZ68_030501 [Dissostichus eleginoides]|nr:hypothetical protein NQZ68_030501 [Dissostichus eleginoides]